MGFAADKPNNYIKESSYKVENAIKPWQNLYITSLIECVLTHMNTKAFNCQQQFPSISKIKIKNKNMYTNFTEDVICLDY